MPKTLQSQAFVKKFRFAVLASDVALFTLHDNYLWLRLIPVNRPPHFTNTEGLPGGLVESTETAEEAAARMIKTKAGVDTKKIYIEQLATFSRIDRDPRGRVVAVAALALVPWEELSEEERADTAGARWCRTDRLPKLAYDHQEISRTALERLRARLEYTTVVSKLLSRLFTLGELEGAYAAILNRQIDKRNFRKKINKLGILASSNKQRTGEKWRPAKLYSFKSKDVQVHEIT